MNTDTGDVYRTPEAIKAALERGEPLAEVSEKVADAVELGRIMTQRWEREHDFLQITELPQVQALAMAMVLAGYADPDPVDQWKLPDAASVLEELELKGWTITQQETDL